MNYKEVSVLRMKIRKKILKENLIPYKCAWCDLESIWNNKSITLQLDHINGINNDNRLENLRFLCPNCHSQTENFAGRANKLPDNFCIDCSTKIMRLSKRCQSCATKFQYENGRKKFDWPSIDILLEMLSKFDNNYSALARHLGVSDNGIRKRFRKFSIPYPKKRKLGRKESNL